MQVRGFLAKSAYLVLGVFSFQRRQVQHRKDEFESLYLGFLLYAAGSKPGHSFLHAHFVDGGRVSGEYGGGRGHVGSRVRVVGQGEVLAPNDQVIGTIGNLGRFGAANHLGFYT